MGSADADNILAIQHIWEVLDVETVVHCQHIYGHQDTRTHPEQQPMEDAQVLKFSLTQKMNISVQKNI